MIQSKARLNQFIDYSGLMFGSIHSTDTDGEIEYHDKAWVFFEIKYRDKAVPYGQRLAFERKTNDIARGGKEAVFFVADHYVDDVDKDVDAAACKVRSFYFHDKWHIGDGSDLKSYVNRFIGWIDGIT